MNAHSEIKIMEASRKLLLDARDDDWEHTLRAVDYGKYLLKYEKGDPEIVIPALYLHDIGWSKVDYSDFKKASPTKKKKTNSVKMHMHYGAEMAAQILRQIEYCRSNRNTIVDIIAAHDDEDAIFAMNNPSAILVLEADRLDRYGLKSLNRYKTMFDMTGNQLKETIKTRRDGLQKWFKTPTAKALATRLCREMGWIE